jgi:septal ring factor EnvC (AmiA/AmiB activator)
MVTSFPRRWVNAAMVFVQGRIVSRHARHTGQSRETIYRDARRVSRELEEGQQQRQQLERRTQELGAEIARLRKAAETSPFEDPDKVAQFAAMAQAEGVSLPVAQRLLTILQAKGRRR